MFKHIDNLFSKKYELISSMEIIKVRETLESLLFINNDNTLSYNRYSFINKKLIGRKKSNGYEIITKEIYKTGGKAILDLEVDNDCVEGTRLNLNFHVNSIYTKFLKVCLSFLYLFALLSVLIALFSKDYFFLLHLGGVLFVFCISFYRNYCLFSKEMMKIKKIISNDII